MGSLRVHGHTNLHVSVVLISDYPCSDPTSGIKTLVEQLQVLAKIQIVFGKQTMDEMTKALEGESTTRPSLFDCSNYAY